MKGSGLDSLRAGFASFILKETADIGVAVIGPGGDTVSVNGDRQYVLMSVAKFPQALALLHFVDEGRISRDTLLHFGTADLKQRTGSTILKDHPGSSFDLPIEEVLRYSIGQSDNITANKMFESVGGPASVDAYVRSLGIEGARFVTDYAGMGPDTARQNRATPRAMAQLLEQFYSKDLLSDSSRAMLWKAMVESSPGADRIKGKLPAGTVVGHKTGTSGTDENTGLTPAWNDAGIVMLPDGRHFSIAVFVNTSRETAAKNSEIIATLSRMAWDHFVSQGR